MRDYLPMQHLLTAFYNKRSVFTARYEPDLLNTEWPPKSIHSLLINIFGINLNEISISG